MAKKQNEKEVIKKVKKDVRQKIIVAECRNPLFGKEIPYKVLYTEKVASEAIAKERCNELREEYKNTEGLSVTYGSL